MHRIWEGTPKAIRLGYGVMVTLQILVLPFLVRIRVPQPIEKSAEKSADFFCSPLQPVHANGLPENCIIGQKYCIIRFQNCIMEFENSIIQFHDFIIQFSQITVPRIRFFMELPCQIIKQCQKLPPRLLNNTNFPEKSYEIQTYIYTFDQLYMRTRANVRDGSRLAPQANLQPLQISTQHISLN